jgi:hypothetical protein
MAALLTTASQVTCPHGGQALLATSNTRVSAAGAPVLLESDVHVVMGCPFTIGPKYSPCVRIEWSAGTSMSDSGATRFLNQSSIGKCLGAEGGPQGVALVVATQAKADGT